MANIPNSQYIIVSYGDFGSVTILEKSTLKFKRNLNFANVVSCFVILVS